MVETPSRHPSLSTSFPLATEHPSFSVLQVSYRQSLPAMRFSTLAALALLPVSALGEFLRCPIQKNVNPWRLSCSSIATITITGPSESSYWWALLSFREVQRFWLMRFATFLFQGSKREQCDHLGLYTGWPEPHFYYRYQRQRHLPQRCLLHCGICRPLSEGPCTLFSPLSLSCSCFFF